MVETGRPGREGESEPAGQDPTSESRLVVDELQMGTRSVLFYIPAQRSRKSLGRTTGIRR